MRHVFSLVDRARQHLDALEGIRKEREMREFRAVLEVGCGTGGFLVEAVRRYEHVVGLDIAFRWLVIAKKRLDELGLRVPLICACAEHLPFKNNAFDLIAAEAVLEHVRDQKVMLRECSRVTSASGMVFAVTANRYSLTSEPHVRVWGVGFLPRSWMKPYVKLVKGVSYEHIKVLSARELNRLLRHCRLHDYRILLPSIPEEEAKHFSGVERLQLIIFNFLKRLPLLRSVLYLVVPLFTVIAFAHKQDLPHS